MKVSDWTMIGSRGETIHGTTHEPESVAKGAVLMAHGFKGYKDYGMFPWLASQFSQDGYIVHRFNFAHSGMLGSDGDFERPDLFECSTWNTQIEDLQILSETFSRPDMPLAIFGHSRGGVAALLGVARGEVLADRVIALSSPSECNSMSEQDQERLLAIGKMESPSGRTGQMLYVGKCFLEEQLAAPEMYQLLELAKNIDVPCLIIHGADDPTVPSQAAIKLVEAIPDSVLKIIAGADHVFNTPNPFPFDGAPTPQLKAVWDAIRDWMPHSHPINQPRVN